jgi:SAM-dependent methyltransferase
MRGTPPYALLSEVYDRDWGGFALGYLRLVRALTDRLGLGSARVLDLGCGTGTLAVELARRGHTVVGIDLCPQMLEIARRKAERVGGVRFEKGDMRSVRIEERFDIVTCTFDAINYVTREAELQATFRSAYGATVSPGWLLFDSVTRQLFEDQNGDTFVRRIGDRRVRQTLRYNMATRAARTTFTFDNGEREVHRQRPWGFAELENALGRSGWQLRDVWRDFEGTRAGERSQRLICTAFRGE